MLELDTNPFLSRRVEVYQRLKGTGESLEAAARGNAIQAIVERLIEGNRNIVPGMLVNRGSIFGLEGPKGGLLRPDFQQPLRLDPDGLNVQSLGVLDITTPRQGSKISKYDDIGDRTDVLINIYTSPSGQ